MMHFARRFMLAAAVLGLMVGGARQASADVNLYATSLEGEAIVKVDITTNVVTTVASLNFQADSLIFANPNTIVFTGISNGTLDSLNLTTNTVTQLASGFSGPRDLTLEPAGNSVLVSDFNNARIERVDLTTHTVSTLASSANYDGTTYVGNNLFAVRNRNTLVQLNPTTGAIIHSLSIGGNLDGLTYDSFTGKLLVGDFNGHVYAVDPNNLAGGVTRTYAAPGGTDGIEGDGNGLLYIASRDFHIYSLNLTSGQLLQKTFVNGLDDLAPVTGLGSLVPEPSTLISSGLGGLILLGYAWRRRRAKLFA